MIASFLAALLIGERTVGAAGVGPLPSSLTGRRDAGHRSGRSTRLDGASIDKGDWQGAEQAFTKVVALKGERADEALYWRAYAYNKMSMREDALKSIASLKTGYPKSTWVKEARALEVEIRQASGQTPQVESASPAATTS